MTDEAVAAEAARLYDESLIWDAHSGFEPSPDVDLRHLNIWKDAGVDYLSINVGFDVMPWTETLESLAAFRNWILQSDDYRLITGTDEIADARKAGQMAVTFDIEGMNALDGQLSMVEKYYELGVRQMLFAYNRNNLAGGGCHDEDVGLTPFGKDVIGEMNRLGMLVDCSHTAYRSTMEAMEVSDDPVIFSHSNPRELWDHERNIRDDQARACAATGGVVGVNGIGLFLGQNDTSSERLVEHIDYLVELIGPAHVGIGLDYPFELEVEVGHGGLGDIIERNPDYWPTRQYPGGRVGCSSPRQFKEVTALMLRRGYDQTTVKGILGENFQRVATAVWHCESL